VLLFDEPLSNLDAKLRRRVRQAIRELQQSLELTVIYVTHDQEEALAVSDQVIVMDRGVIAQQGSPAELYDAPRSRFLADFIGDANLVAGELVDDGGGQVFRANGVSVPVRADGVAAGPATLAVRPHRLVLTAPGGGMLPAECRRAAYLGSRVEYVLDTPWGDLLVFDPAVPATLARGDRAGVAFRPEDAIVLAGRA
jgi:iron(III) transport system ATP-binding protein